MPFTFSHPALVLPFIYRQRPRFSATALVAGSVAPDFENIIRMGGGRGYSHSWHGLLWFDLPVALLLTFVFHAYIRGALISHLPLPLYRRFARYQTFRWPDAIRQNRKLVLLSVGIGALTHLLWDGFTNERGFIVRAIPSLQAVVDINDVRYNIYALLFLVNSLIGVVILVWAVWKLPVQPVRPPQRNVLLYWVVMALLTCVVFYIHYASITDVRKLMYWHLYISQYVTAAIAAFLLALFLTSFGFAYAAKGGGPVGSGRRR